MKSKFKDCTCPQVFSLVMGDKEDKWREKPFQMTLGGPFWVPPKMPQYSVSPPMPGERIRATPTHQIATDP